MGACVLCGKSAGPFYSLHKGCYSKYDSSKETIANYLRDELGLLDSSELASKVHRHIADFKFVAEAQKRTLNRALEFYHSRDVDNKQFSLQQINSWIELLDTLSPDETLFVNQFFLQQQYNLRALNALSNSSLPESNRHPANYSIAMHDQEELWWCFDEGSVEQDTPVENKRQWSVLMQVVNSTLMHKNKRAVENVSLGRGKLLVTNNRIYFESDTYTDELKHGEIYSVTPIKNGVRIQSKANSSKSKSYLCEDARLLFAFIKFAHARHQP